MSKKKISIMAVSGFVIISLFAIGCNRGRYFMSKSPAEKITFIADRIANKLDFTKNQKIQLDVIKKEILSKTDFFQSGREDMLNSFIKIIKSDKISPDELNSLINKREAMMKKNRPFFVKEFIAFHSILTAEQKKKVVEKIEKFHNHMGK